MRDIENFQSILFLGRNGLSYEEITYSDNEEI